MPTVGIPFFLIVLFLLFSDLYDRMDKKFKFFLWVSKKLVLLHSLSKGKDTENPSLMSLRKIAQVVELVDTLL